MLLNELSAAIPSFPATERIVPLDPVLTASATERLAGASLGARVSRVINPRLTAEATVEYGLSRLEITSASLPAIEASRQTFASTWTAVFGFTPFLTPNVTSVSSIDGSRGRQLLTTGAVNISLKTKGKVVPYATLGAGVASNIGGSPGVSLVGHYAPRFNGVTPFDETDAVKVRFAIPDHVFVGAFGGGIKHNVSPRWGWRADIRAHLSPNRIDTIVETRPAVSALTPSAALSFPVNPTVQFANNPSTGSHRA